MVVVVWVEKVVEREDRVVELIGVAVVQELKEVVVEVDVIEMVAVVEYTALIAVVLGAAQTAASFDRRPSFDWNGAAFLRDTPAALNRAPLDLD